jgi:hypothetical protein
MILETTDDAVLAEVRAIQDKEGGALDDKGKPKIGCKKINGVYVPLDQLPGYDPSKWRGTTEIHAIEVDAKDPKIKRLTLTDDTISKIDMAKAKKAEDRTPEEAKLALATVKDTEPKP